ncbi:MAG: hypothetical protein AB8G86_06425 [Saprospiraceae bacterium]
MLPIEYLPILYLSCFLFFACADLEELAPVNSIPTASAITDFYYA